MDINFILDKMRESGNQLALVSDERDFSFADVLDKYEKAKESLNEFQIKPGDIVALCADYTPVSIACMLALIERDVVLVPMARTSKNIEFYLKISEAGFYINIVNEQLNLRKLDTIVEHPMLVKLIKGKKPGLILFSSGTTGEPKAILHDLTKLMEKFHKPGKVLRTITFLMFDHIGGFNTLMHALANGGTIITIKTRNVEEVCDVIQKYKVELLPASPTFLNMMLLSRLYENYDLSSLKIISYGTEPMAESTLRKLNQIFPDVKLKQTYGLAELGITASKSEKSDSLWMKLGGEGYQFKVVDDILYIKADSAMLGYLNAPSLFDDEGWFNTKDKVLVKGDYIKILGRTTDLINVGGEKVYPIEVEGVLLKIDGVKDARVYGEDYAVTGKRIVAQLFVDEKNNNRDFKNKVRTFCKEHLEKAKIPSKIKLTCDALYGERLKKERK